MGHMYRAILNGMNLLASLGILAMTVLIAADVIFRVALDSPIVGVPEIVKVAIVCIVWLQMAYTLRMGGHLRSNLIFAVLPRPLKRVVYGLNCLGGICVFGLIVWFSYDDVMKTFVRGTFEGEHPVRIPVWPVWSILVLGAGLMVVEYARQMWCVLSGLWLDELDEPDTPNTHPVDKEAF